VEFQGDLSEWGRTEVESFYDASDGEGGGGRDDRQGGLLGKATRARCQRARGQASTPQHGLMELLARTPAEWQGHDCTRCSHPSASKGLTSP
jgi:hypothetical protein